MTRVKQLVGMPALGVALLLGAGRAAPAQAAYTVTLTEDGSGNVDATGSGTIDLSGLSLSYSTTNPALIGPAGGYINTGPESSEPVDVYTGFTGPTSFGGGGGFTVASSGSGDMVGIFGGDQLAVPAGYLSGNPLSDMSTYDNTTFSMLGVTPGTYVWTWEAPGAAGDDSFTLIIPAAAVPEPSSIALLALPLGLVMLLAARQRPATGGL